MPYNYIWLLPLAGVLMGFAASSAFLRIRPVLTASYSRNNYSHIECSDMKLGLIFSVLALMSAMLASIGYVWYQNIKINNAILAVTERPGAIIDITDIGQPPILDDRNIPTEPIPAEIATAPTLGVPKPVPNETVSEKDALTQRELSAVLSARTVVDVDTIKGPLEFVKNDSPPEKGTYQELSRPPVLLKSVKPIYPSICINGGFEGRVYLNLLLGLDGRVKTVDIVKSSGNPAFDESAIEAAVQFIFSPAISPDGKAVRVWVAYPITFSLAK